MYTTFPDRRDCLFGREIDLRYLGDRAQTPGITAIVARAQMGKSWVLTELARRLSEDSFLVGYMECGEPMDLFSRTVADLYARWLSDATWREQARIVWAQQSDDLVVKTGTTVGSLFKSLSKLLGTPTESVGDLVKSAFDAMADAQHDLKSGRLDMKPLESEEVRALLTSVQRISSRRLVIIFDQWEKSPTIETEQKLLEIFRRHMFEWPPCHIFIGTQREAKAWAPLDELRAGAPDGWIELFDLPPMHLDESSAQQTLLSFVREKVPIARSAENNWLLNRIDGNPAVVYRWVGAREGSLGSIEALDRAAQEANAYVYRELTNVLSHLAEPERVLAMRFALLPAISDAARWRLLRPVVLDVISPSTLDDLRNKHVLETGSIPTFGHSKRAEAALRWFKQYREEEIRLVANDISLSLAAKLQKLTPEEKPFESGLAGLAVEGIEISPFANVLRTIIRHSHGFDPPAPEEVIQAVGALASDQTLAPGAVLLAWGLDDAIKHAQDRNAPDQCDRLLEEIRQLARRHSDTPIVRECFARALFRVLNSLQKKGPPDRRDLLLDELRGLQSTYPAELGVRKLLAMSLNNTLFALGEDAPLDRCKLLLDELRKLSAQYPLDANLREPFAKALYNGLCHRREASDPLRSEALLDELRHLSVENPSDAVVRERFADGLVVSLRRAHEENRSLRETELLHELRQLAARSPADEELRAKLARGLGFTLSNAAARNELDRRDAVLDELRQLSKAYANDVEVRKQFSVALVKTFEDEKATGRASLLDELRNLVATHPDDAVVRRMFANALRLARRDPWRVTVLDTQQIPLEELGSLSTTHPEDTDVREVFAIALTDALGGEKEATDIEFQRGVINQLRELSRVYSNEAGVRVQFALGLFRAVLRVEQVNLLKYRQDMIEELRELANCNPEDSAVREYLFKVLLNSLLDSLRQNAILECESLLAEIRRLAAINLSDPAAREWLAKALLSGFLHAYKRNDHLRSTELLNELRQYVKEFPNDAFVAKIAPDLANIQPAQG